jgi:small-conductance mechanosensitive channel
MYRFPGLSEPASFSEMIAAASFLVGGLVLGWAIQRLVIRRLRRRASITTWGGDDIVVGAIRDVVMVWLTIGGAFGAISVLPLSRGLDRGLGTFLVASIIVSATIVLGRVVSDVIKLYSLRSRQTMRSSSIFVNLARIVIAAIGALVLLQTLGVSITPLLTALGVGGLAVALAMQDTLSNFFAGLQIIATKKVKPGDFVRLETGEEGHIADIDWRHTSMRQLRNNMVLVPNARLVNSIVTNYYYPQTEMSVLVDVGVSYASDLSHVERVTIEVAREVLHDIEGGVSDFEPFIRYHTFNDSSIDLTVILRVREFTDQYLLKHAFVKRLHERYAAEGIVIPFPIRTLEWMGAGASEADRGARPANGRRARG